MSTAPVVQLPHARAHIRTSAPMRHTAPLDRLPELLAFRAPYLEEKLASDRVVATREEAARLFDEAKKYLVITFARPDVMVPMFSRRVDEAWHQLVLYTREYARFSETFFGAYVHHAPTAAEEDDHADERPRLSFAEFRAEYERLFGAISELWDDTLSITCATRLIRVTYRKRLVVRDAGAHAEVALLREPPVVLLRTDRCAGPAVTFALHHDAFHVRELPGLNDDADRILLARALVDAGLARVAT